MLQKTAAPPVTRRTPVWIDRTGFGAMMIMPVFLHHGRGLADITLILIDALFLARCALMRDWGWLRATWVRATLVWWAWLLVCTPPGTPLFQAAGVIRFPLLAAALADWVLREATARRWLLRVLRWSAYYIAAQSLFQFATGRNTFGFPRAGDGELTGPYDRPRAAAPMSRLLFPALLPLASTQLRAVLLLIGGFVIMLLIGQRMPLLLTLLGLVVTGLLLPQLRRPVLWAGFAVLLMLAALPFVSPQAAHRIIDEFSRQMAHLPQSHYGEIYARSVEIVRQHPIFGAGFDGFRTLCYEPRYFHGWDGGDGGGADICVQHPHSFYLQAAVEGGIPGVILFSVMAFLWLRSVGHGLLRHPDRLRVGLFVAVLIQLWPIAAGMDWAAMPLSGWFFTLFGLALAETAPYMRGPRISFEA